MSFLSSSNNAILVAEHSFHGIRTSRQKTESVTRVSGTNCHRCLGAYSPRRRTVRAGAGQPAPREAAMKITDVLAYPLAVDYERATWTAHERMERAQLVLIEVRTDQGITGFGEAAGGPQKQICDLVNNFADVVRGMDPLG